MDMLNLVPKMRANLLKEGDLVGILPDSFLEVKEKNPHLKLKLNREYLVLEVIAEPIEVTRPVKLILGYDGGSFEVSYTNIWVKENMLRKIINRNSRKPCCCGSGKYYDACHLEHDLKDL